MTLEREQLVRDSFRLLEQHASEAARLFYDRLFVLDPSTRVLFDGVDMVRQGEKFVAMLGTIVRALDQPPQLVGGVAALGRQHAHLRTTRAQYESVGAALLWTVERVLGTACTPEVRAGWIEAYALIAAVMQRVAAAPVAVRPGAADSPERVPPRRDDPPKHRRPGGG